MRMKEKNILWIDWGSKYVGLAYKQGSTGMIFPIGYMMNDNTLMYQIGEVLLQYHIASIVVWWPKKQEDIQKQIKSFWETLQLVAGADIPLSYVDEDYTSVEAGARVSNFTKNVAEDTLSAMILLERA